MPRSAKERQEKEANKMMAELLKQIEKERQRKKAVAKKKKEVEKSIFENLNFKLRKWHELFTYFIFRLGFVCITCASISIQYSAALYLRISHISRGKPI